MSIASTLGPQSLAQLGISVSDIALIYSQGRKFGNWLTARRNDEELFESILEDPESLLKRRGIVDVSRMDSMFPDVHFIYRGTRTRTTQKQLDPKGKEALRDFAWLMVVIVAVMDLCLPPEALAEFLIGVFVRLLNNEEAESGLRVGLDASIESWRSLGQVRRLVPVIRKALQRAWREKTETESIPQLNPTETDEMAALLYQMMSRGDPDFTCISAATFSAARAMETAGIHIATTVQNRSYPEQFMVTYASEVQSLPNQRGRHHPRDYDDPLRLQKQVIKRMQIISYPADKPHAMIYACQAASTTLNHMVMLWDLGARAAAEMELSPKADLPYIREVDFYYELRLTASSDDFGCFTAANGIIASKAFPSRSQAVSRGVEKLLEGLTEHRITWLEQHTGLEYLIRDDSTIPSRRSENMELFLCYQALIFGFYHRLLRPLVTFDFLADKGEGAFFQGVWGYGSKAFLAMCTQFGQEFRSNGRVDRTHMLHMLAAMFGGRLKHFSPASSRRGLVGVFAPTSVIALPLLQVSDEPQQLSKYAVLDLPLVHLTPNEDGELYAGHGIGISFTHIATPPLSIRPRGPRDPSKWSVHSSMAKAFRDGGMGVVMAARCAGRLVGWFSPGAADTMFLSTAYQNQRHDEDDAKNMEAEEAPEVQGFEILDEHWQSGKLWRPLAEENSGLTLGVVQSAGCPALRYAAAGFYGGCGEEVAIVTDDVAAAVGRVEAQDAGIVIT
jgi:hypothetical protein